MPQFECGAPNCDFLVRANDEDEIVAIVQRHAKENHGRDVDEDHVRRPNRTLSPRADSTVGREG